MRWVSRESAAFAWLVLFLLINAYWISYDLWAGATGHRSLTSQMRMWLHETLIGPFMFAFIIFIAVAFLFHLLVKGTG